MEDMQILVLWLVFPWSHSRLRYINYAANNDCLPSLQLAFVAISGEYLRFISMQLLNESSLYGCPYGCLWGRNGYRSYSFLYYLTISIPTVLDILHTPLEGSLPLWHVKLSWCLQCRRGWLTRWDFTHAKSIHWSRQYKEKLWSYARPSRHEETSHSAMITVIHYIHGDT